MTGPFTAILSTVSLPEGRGTPCAGAPSANRPRTANTPLRVATLICSLLCDGIDPRNASKAAGFLGHCTKSGQRRTPILNQRQSMPENIDVPTPLQSGGPY